MAFQKRALERDVVRVDSDVTMRRGFFDAPKARASSTPRAPAAPASTPPSERRTPRADDFDVDFAFETPPGTSASACENVLVLLHGDLDSPANFLRFGRALNLPHTAVVALGGTLDMYGNALGAREAPMRRWFLSKEEGASDAGRQDALENASARIRRGLLRMRDARGWSLDRVHVFGFSDGGTVALDLATQMVGADSRLGSCAAAYASLLEPDRESRYGPCADAPTPVLLLGGARDEEAPMGRVRATAAALERRNHGCGAQVCEFDKTHSMISSEPETRALMTFWGKTLKVPRTKAEDYGDDVIELGGDATARAV